MVPGAAVGKRENRAADFSPRWRPPNLRGGAVAETRATILWSCALGALTVASLLGYVWVRIQVVEAGYRLSVAQQLVERLEREGRELEVRVAAADAPGRLQALARTRLAMRRPGIDEEAPLP